MPKWIFNPFTGNLDAIEEGQHFFEATCTGAEELYDLVYVSAAGLVVRTVDIDDINKMPPVGMIVELNGTSCTVQTEGEVALAGLTPGRPYFAGVDGKVTTTRPPAPPTGKRFIQMAGVALDTSVFLLRIDGSPSRIIT